MNITIETNGSGTKIATLTQTGPRGGTNITRDERNAIRAELTK